MNNIVTRPAHHQIGRWTKLWPPKRNMELLAKVGSSMDKLKLTGQNLDRVFKSRLGSVCTGHGLYTFCKTAKLKVENLAQTTLRFSPVSFRAPQFQ